MKIINNSGWRTADLRRLLKECFNRAGMMHSFSDLNRTIHHTVEIRTHGNEERSYSGRASIRGKWILVRVPKTEFYERVSGSDGSSTHRTCDARFNPLAFAHTVLHELAHNRGIHHRDMAPELRWKSGWENYVSWAQWFVVLPKPIREKKHINVVDARSQRAIFKVKEYHIKIARAQKNLKKWEKKVKYYQRVRKNDKA